MRILFTGGSGKAGRHAIEHLVECGHRVTNVDLVPAGIAGVPDLRVDLTAPRQVFNALSAYARHDELEGGTGAGSASHLCALIVVRSLLRER